MSSDLNLSKAEQELFTKPYRITGGGVGLPAPMFTVLKSLVHTKPISCVKYNPDGDLIVAASTDNNISLYNAKTAECLGLYEFGNGDGAVQTIDLTFDSRYLLSGTGASLAILYDALTGRRIYSFPHSGTVRAVAWADGAHMFATVCDQFSRHPPCLSIYEVKKPGAADIDLSKLDSMSRPIGTFREFAMGNGGSYDKAVCLAWTFGNERLVVGFDSGALALFDPRDVASGPIKTIYPHSKRINNIQFNKDKTLLVTASTDRTSKLLDPETLEIISTFESEVPVFTASISPTHPHVLLGGGEEKQNITTSGAEGHFEVKFFNYMLGDYMGYVAGPFGPTNSIAIHPKGESFVTGSEDGFLRLYPFPASYLSAHTSEFFESKLNKLK